MYIHKENFVKSQQRGVVCVDDVDVGEYVLCQGENGNDTYSPICYKKYDDVDCNKIKLDDGSELILSKTSIISTNSYAIKPLKVSDDVCDITNADLGWFIGCHTGDGTCDIRENYYRLRIIGDNENVISEYSKISNYLTQSKTNYHITTKYNSPVWNYTICNTKVKKLVTTYFDNMVGKKTHTGKVSSYIKEKELWIPYLAGLMDSDGCVKKNGTIEIMMCMTSVINELCIYLSSRGIRYHYSYKTSVRENETPIHRLTIYLNEPIVMDIVKYMKHDIKITNIKNGNSEKYVGNYFPVSSSVLTKIENFKPKYKTRTYTQCISYRRYICENKKMSSGMLKVFLDAGAITRDEYNDMRRYGSIKQIADSGIHNCVDIKTNIGNVYCGRFGLINSIC